MKETKPTFLSETKLLLRLRGRGAKDFVQGQTTIDIYKKDIISSFIYGCWLDLLGRVCAILEIKVLDDCIELVVIGGDLNEVINGFKKVIFPADNVELEAPEEIQRFQYMPLVSNERFSDVFWLKKDGLIPDKFKKIFSSSEEEWQIWRIKKGLPIGALEINGNFNPYEIGLGDLVDLKKGCYFGQEVIAKLNKSNEVRYKIRYLAGKYYPDFIREDVKYNIACENNTNAGVVTSIVSDKKNSKIHSLALIKSSLIDCKELLINKKIFQVHVPESFTSFL